MYFKIFSHYLKFKSIARKVLVFLLFKQPEIVSVFIVFANGKSTKIFLRASFILLWNRRVVNLFLYIFGSNFRDILVSQLLNIGQDKLHRVVCPQDADDLQR